MASEASPVFEFPNRWTIDGLNLHRGQNPEGVEDVRLCNKDTLLIATYPRTGTTWFSHIVSLLQAGEERYDSVKQINIFERVPYAELIPQGADKAKKFYIESFLKPLVVKTHLPYRFIKKWIDDDQVKTIVTTRNPKDTLVSMYHFYKTMKSLNFNGTWDEFLAHVKANKQLYGDQLEWYNDWEKHCDNPNILFLTYEDMKKDINQGIEKIVSFLNLDCSVSFQQKVANESSIKKMKENKSTNIEDDKYIKAKGEFIRKGISGEWKKYFTVEQNELFDDKYKEGYSKCKLNIDY